MFNALSVSLIESKYLNLLCSVSMLQQRVVDSENIWDVSRQAHSRLNKPADGSLTIQMKIYDCALY